MEPPTHIIASGAFLSFRSHTIELYDEEGNLPRAWGVESEAIEMAIAYARSAE
jgi:hypothetical protein